MEQPGKAHLPRSLIIGRNGNLNQDQSKEDKKRSFDSFHKGLFSHNLVLAVKGCSSGLLE